ncbi:MAG TPA: hypothetical protein VF841_00210 [Anaeromyxobacter sp.]
MRSVLPLALLLVAAAAPREGCGNGRAPPYDPCAGKACGDACKACPPGDASCFETAELKACDPFHRCVPQVDGLCAAAQQACAGKACGAQCAIDPPCRSATPPCMMPSLVGYCDPGGACVAGTAPPPGTCPSQQPSWGCVGKACGDGCGYCPPGTDPASCPVPTLVATACDAQLQCVPVAGLTCSPQAACQGKACGAACDTCPACAGPGPAAQSCDASGACVAGATTCPP